MVLAIFINTLALSLDRYPISEKENKTLEDVNDAMVVVFLFEMLIKIAGLGFKEYSQDSFNLFDAIIVLISIIELVIENAGIKFSYGAFSALRAIRIMRVFKLARNWKSFRNLLR